MADLLKTSDSGAGGSNSSDAAPFPLPRVTIKFCTQCKWMLRAAYYAQELLSTFSTSLGEVALQPSTGGTFIVEIFHQHQQHQQHQQPSSTSPPSIASTTLWDRKTNGGFPETKELKRRVRDVIEPGRNLGHVDRDHARPTPPPTTTTSSTKEEQKEGGENKVVAAAAAAETAPGKDVGGGGGQGQAKEECEDCK